MPTTMLPFLWLLATTTHLAAFVPPTRADLPRPVAVQAPRPVAFLAPASEATPAEPEWALIESDTDEETEDGERIGVASSHAVRPPASNPFGLASSNPHPAILPRSALRSPILRC